MATQRTIGHSYILIDDVEGEKATGKVMAALGRGPKPVQVLLGELLDPIPPRERVPRKDGTPTHNARSRSDPTVTLYSGDPEDDKYVHPLDLKETQILEAIENRVERFFVFAREENKLKWGSSLNKGDQVYVKIPSPDASSFVWSVALVKYAGVVETLPGWNFGVEIKDSRYYGRGSTDGWFGGRRYFQCDADCGLFVSLDRLAHEQRLRSYSVPNRFTNKPAVPTLTKHSLSCDPFTVGDHAVVYSKANVPIHGTIRWIGAEIQTKKLDSNHIGIETDAAVSPHDFTKALTKIPPPFISAQPAHCLIVPEDSVFRVELANTPEPSSENTEEERMEEKRKRADSELAELKNALEESINVAAQQRALEAFSQEKKAQCLQRKAQREKQQARASAHFELGGSSIKPKHLEKPKVDHPYDRIPGMARSRSSSLDERLSESLNLEVGSVVKISTNHGHEAAQDAHQQPPPEFAACVGTSNPHNLGKGSAVQVLPTNPNDLPHYGVIRWIGTLSGIQGQVAGIELEEYLDGCTDGTFKATQQKFFNCIPGHGLYFPLASLSPDKRVGGFSEQTSPLAASLKENPVGVPLEEQEDQLIHDSSKQIRRYTGSIRGIQGHQNSSYLDATIFGLFALSDVFDALFLEADQSIKNDLNRKAINDLLWKGIVNPLRKYGVVRYESVMKLKDRLGMLEGITWNDKDPEEFLNVLFKNVLHTRPFFSVRQPFGVEHEFFIQLSVEPDPNLEVPTVGELLEKMFKKEISFTKVPSKLLIRIPQFGGEYKPYSKIVPELEISIQESTESLKRVPCYTCGEKSDVKCEDCGTLSGQSHTYYCQRCSDLFHNNPAHKERVGHNVTDVDLDGPIGELDLLSVICIETSHYVCFTRDPRDDTERKWIFFDSMAERVHDTYYIPKVTDCTRELNEWVYSGDCTRLMSTQPRQLPELVRRFTQDIYMCVYIQPDMAMYGDAEGDTQFEEQDCTPQEINQLKCEDSTSGAEESSLQQENSEQIYSQDNKCKNLVNELQHQVESQQIEIKKCKQQLQVKEVENQQLKRKNRELEKEAWKPQSQILQLRLERLKLQQQIGDLQQKLDLAPASEGSISRFSKVQIPSQDQDSWNVQRREVVIQDPIGCGAWGCVHKGLFHGRPVAIKRAHQEILHKNTVDQLLREVRILALVQHPYLVRLIAAVVDEDVRDQKESPLLVLELMDTNLRAAYQAQDLGKHALLSIFRDVAYALHYLHEHQEPIIHRDVSAPNVLLQQTHPGVWRAKLSDFGSANLVKRCMTSATGAIIYSAPETFPPENPNDSLPKQTTKIDVYSYGYLLAESITKEMPSTEKRAAMLSRIKQEWKPMHDIITACTMKEPERRLTMAQVLEKLNALVWM